MKLIDNLDKIELKDSNKYFLEEILNDYENYIYLIGNMGENLLKYYLNTLKNNEIMNNQQAEEENSFLISLYNNMYKENSLNRIIKIMNEREDLTKEDLKILHKILMKGTKTEIGSGDFRQTDTKFVGTFNEDGTKNIDYMPIPSQEIEYNIDRTLEFLNDKNIDNPFINAFITHGLISVMQPFDDGNTRTSRLIQHAKIWKNTNSLYNKNFEKPLLYLSKNYLLTRGTYRRLITDIAKYEDNEAWNKWIEYNLNMVNEQLYYLNNNIKKLIK